MKLFYIFTTLLGYLLSSTLTFADTKITYKSAAECFTNAQNAGLELRDVGLNTPTFTCIQVSKDKELKIYRQGFVSKFPF
jgi:hypothetical protein